MTIDGDFTVALNGDIRYTGGGSTYFTVLELHRFLQDLADDAEASGNDLLDITSTKPSERSTDNIIELVSPYNIDDDAAEQLYDGSITQEGGDTVYSGLVVVGAVESGTELMIIKDNVLVTDWWGTGINAVPASNILLRIIIKTRDEGIDLDGKRVLVMAREFGDTYSEFSATLGLGNGTAAIFTAEDLNNTTLETTVNGWDCSNTEGYQLIDLNNGEGDQPYYSQWDLGTQTDINDIYEFTKDIQRRTSVETIHTIDGELFRGITSEFTYNTESANFSEDATIAWGCTFEYDTEASGPFTLGERLDFGTSNAVARLIGLVDDTAATGKMVVQVESGTPANTNTITGYTSATTAIVSTIPAAPASTAGTGLLLALDDEGTTGTMWIQRLTGADPVEDTIVRQVGGVDTAITCVVGSTITARTVSPSFYGASTGSSIIGAFGVGHLPGDLSDADKLFDLTNTLRQPPNNQVFYVYKVVVDEDRVMVATNDGADEIELEEYALNGTLTDNVTTAVLLTGPIDSDTPSSGTIRIQDDNGIYTRQPYTSWDTNTFTLTAAYQGSDDANATSGNYVFVSYIDKVATGVTESYSAIYTATPRSLIVKVRDGGTAGDNEPIKPFKTGATFGSSGGSATAIRTSDV